MGQWALLHQACVGYGDFMGQWDTCESFLIGIHGRYPIKSGGLCVALSTVG